MVPIVSALAILITDARLALARQAATVATRSSSDQAFVAWLGIGAGSSDVLSELAARAAKHVEGSRTYQDVAVLGFAADAGLATSAQIDMLASGLTWLAGREASVFGSPAAFVNDPIALLGIAVGARSGPAHCQQSMGEWMTRCLEQRASVRQSLGWHGAVIAAIAHTLGTPQPASLWCGESMSDVRVALQSRQLLPEAQPDEADADAQRTLILAKTDPVPEEATLAAVRLYAIDWVMRSTPVVTLRQPSVAQVCELLRRVPSGLERWTWEEKPRVQRRGAQARKWHIDHEYHVQNLLWSILAPIFPDATYEEYTRQVGQMSPRADIGIPSLRLLIEAKFVRPGKPFNHIIEEVAADASLYRVAGSRYATIIPFVWDHSHRTEQHANLVRGLRQIEGVTDAVVVSRPGSMDETSPAPAGAVGS